MNFLDPALPLYLKYNSGLYVDERYLFGLELEHLFYMGTSIKLLGKVFQTSNAYIFPELDQLASFP